MKKIVHPNGKVEYEGSSEEIFELEKNLEENKISKNKKRRILNEDVIKDNRLHVYDDSLFYRPKKNIIKKINKNHEIDFEIKNSFYF